MGVTLDGLALFENDKSQFEVGSFGREHIERSVAGLDGVISIDIGGRGRKIRQKGELRARSKTELNDRIAVISAFMDGQTHTLVTSDTEMFENVRLDSVSVKNITASGSGIVGDYEIIYTQLTV
jgi:hypothetical protein